MRTVREVGACNAVSLAQVKNTAIGMIQNEDDGCISALPRNPVQ